MTGILVGGRGKGKNFRLTEISYNFCPFACLVQVDLVMSVTMINSFCFSVIEVILCSRGKIPYGLLPSGYMIRRDMTSGKWQGVSSLG